MDWRAWHARYEHDGKLRERLRIVQKHIRRSVDEAPPGTVRLISACAGDGRDVLTVLRNHPRRADVRGRLVELDPVLAAAAERAAPRGIEVVRGDASTTDAYAGAVPADLILLCGIFGNVADEDVERTVRTVPSLAAAGATVVWTRHRRPPDLTVDIRRWFAESGFEEVAFDAPPTSDVGVGVHRFVGAPAPFVRGRTMFTFVPEKRAEPSAFPPTDPPG